MKKLKYIICTAAASMLLSISALAATGQISFSDPSVTLGSDVNVTMKVKSADGTLSKADITVTYDTSVLEFVSGTDADGGAGTVRIHGASNGAGTGELAYNLKFKTLTAGPTNINISTQEVYDSSEALVDITHQGSATVQVAAEASASGDASLAELTVSPGELSPAFSADVTSYDVTVGTDVERLAINAVAAGEGASVSVSGNDALNMGENAVSITVKAQDGTQTVYNLKVTKQEGGASDTETGTETVNEGVKLSSKEKTITIMNPGSDVEIPSGFAESTIDIDGHQVKGWVWKADSDHQYCILYGMNDAGELSFYRYDLTEKTLQRYFEDPVEIELQQNAEAYPALLERYDALVNRYNFQFILSCVLGVVSLALCVGICMLLRKNRKRGMDTVRKMNQAEENGSISIPAAPVVEGAEDAFGETRVMPSAGDAGAGEDLGETCVMPTAARRAAAETEDADLESTVLLDRKAFAENAAETADSLGETTVIPSAVQDDLDIEDL